VTTTDTPATRRPLAVTVAEASNWASPASPAEAATTGRALLAAVLDDLRGLDVTIPAGVTRALGLVDNVDELLRPPSSIGRWLADQDPDELTTARIAAAMQERHLATALADDHAARAEITAHLVDRAVDALADDLDAVVDQLRPRWDEAANVLAAAAAAGVHSETTAEEAIASDVLVEHWRALTPAVATLDELDRVVHRSLFVSGYPLAVDEQARTGRAAWLRACTTGPVELVAPSARPDVDDDGRPRVGNHRSGTAAELHAERAAESTARQQAVTEQRRAWVHADARQRALAEAAQAVADDENVLDDAEFQAIGAGR